MNDQGPWPKPEEFQKRLGAAIAKSREFWGADFHMRLCQEECAELIAAINHYDRGRMALVDVAEEVADVFLVLHAASEIVGDDAVNRNILRKLERLEQRIAENSERHEHNLRRLWVP